MLAIAKRMPALQEVFEGKIWGGAQVEIPNRSLWRIILAEHVVQIARQCVVVRHRALSVGEKSGNKVLAIRIGPVIEIHREHMDQAHHIRSALQAIELGIRFLAPEIEPILCRRIIQILGFNVQNARLVVDDNSQMFGPQPAS